MVNNFVSGLILLFDRSLKIGDFIELDSDTRGTVRAINIRSTRITTNDNIDVLVPALERLFNARFLELAGFRTVHGVPLNEAAVTAKQAQFNQAGGLLPAAHVGRGHEVLQGRVTKVIHCAPQNYLDPREPRNAVAETPPTLFDRHAETLAVWCRRVQP